MNCPNIAGYRRQYRKYLARGVPQAGAQLHNVIDPTNDASADVLKV